MGQTHSRSSGKQLLAACYSGNTTACRAILQDHPSAACYVTYMEKISPLLIAAGRGHARLVQAILEAAVLSQGLSRAKKRCINHSSSKGQSALMVACMNGHAQVVEMLVCNGASPLVLDNARHNSALHWAASCCRADCVGRLLGSGATFQMQSGQLVAIADIPCFDEDNSTLVKFVDRHNGWGLTALHLAACKGSSSTVHALLRHGACVSSRTTPASLAISPTLQPPGSTALHFAAAAEDVSVVLVLLEAQVSRDEPDLRRAVNARGERPLDVAPTSSNPLLLQLLDPSHSLSLHPGPRTGIVLNPGSSSSRVITREGLRQQQALLGLSSGFRPGGRRGSEQPAHIALGALLQRLKLVLVLEAFALQQQLGVGPAAAAVSGSNDSVTAAMAVSSLLAKQQQAKEQQVLVATAGDEPEARDDDVIGTAADLSLTRTNSAADGTAEAQGIAQPLNPMHQNQTDLGYSSGSSPPEISPDSSSGVDDTCPVLDSSQRLLQQQQQQWCTAESAAQQMRLKTLERLISAVNELLACLPASATAAGGVSGHSSPRASSSGQQQQQHPPAPIDADTHGSSAGGRSSNWGLLGGLLTRAHAGHQEGVQDHHQGSQQQHEQPQLLGRLRSSRHGSSRSRSSSPAAAGAESAAAGGDAAAAGLAVPIPEDILAAYITPSSLSSLAAVTKLFVGASGLAGQQQELGLHGLGGSGCGAVGSSTRWAEQEHALVLMRGILQTVRTSLEAAQQAAAAAASRSALRVRHQQQMASLLGSDRPVHSHSLRRALLGERLAERGGRIRFGSSSSSTSRPDRHHSSHSPAYVSGLSMPWGMEAPLAGLTSSSGSPMRHQSRRHHRDRSRRSRGEGDVAGPDNTSDRTSRRHRRHHSRHHRSSRRNRTPRAVDLPLHDTGRAAASPPAQLGSNTSNSNGTNSAARVTASSSSSSSSSYSTPTASVAAASHQQQEQEQYWQQLGGRLQDEVQADAAVDMGSAGSSHSTVSASSPTQAAAAAQPSDFTAAYTTDRHSSSSGSSSQSEVHADEASLLHLNDTPPCHDSDNEVLAAAASSCSSLDAATCSICMDCTAGLSVSRCSHSLCLQCAYQLCFKAKGLPLCPFCRQPIDGFDACTPVTAPGS